MSAYTGISGSAERRRTRPLLRAGPEPALMSREAAVRWLLLLLVGLVDWVWMGCAGFHIGPGAVQSIGFISLLIFISIFYFYTARDDRIMHFAHFGAQYLALFAVLTVLSYLAVSTNAPLVDDALNAIDKAMGLDWVTWTKWLAEHSTLGVGIVYRLRKPACPAILLLRAKRPHPGELEKQRDLVDHVFLCIGYDTPAARRFRRATLMFITA